MKRVYRLEELDCANCAAKMEAAIRKIPGVNSATINFFSQKLTIDADDGTFDDVLQQAARAVRKIEPDCRIIL